MGVENDCFWRMEFLSEESESIFKKLHLVLLLIINYFYSFIDI